MRATALTALSSPIDRARRVFGTHCMRRMGTAGVNRGNARDVHRRGRDGRVRSPRGPRRASRPAATKPSPAAAVRVKPNASWTRENTKAETPNETAARDVSVAPIFVGPMPKVPLAYMGKNESNVLCPACTGAKRRKCRLTAVTRPVPSGHAPRLGLARRRRARRRRRRRSRGGTGRKRRRLVSMRSARVRHWPMRPSDPTRPTRPAAPRR